jgi:hypothetical protein
MGLSWLSCALGHIDSESQDCHFYSNVTDLSKCFTNKRLILTTSLTNKHPSFLPLGPATTQSASRGSVGTWEPTRKDVKVTFTRSRIEGGPV